MKDHSTNHSTFETLGAASLRALANMTAARLATRGQSEHTTLGEMIKRVKEPKDEKRCQKEERDGMSMSPIPDRHDDDLSFAIG